MEECSSELFCTPGPLYHVRIKEKEKPRKKLSTELKHSGTLSQMQLLDCGKYIVVVDKPLNSVYGVLLQQSE